MTEVVLVFFSPFQLLKLAGGGAACYNLRIKLSQFTLFKSVQHTVIATRNYSLSGDRKITLVILSGSF